MKKDASQLWSVFFSTLSQVLSVFNRLFLLELLVRMKSFKLES